MARYWNVFGRKAGPFLAAGYLLQAGGCVIDPTAFTGAWLTAVMNNLIASLVYGLFNIPLSGF